MSSDIDTSMLRDENYLILMSFTIEFGRRIPEARKMVLEQLMVLPASMAESVAKDDPVIVSMILPSLMSLVDQFPRQIHKVKVLPWLYTALSRTDVTCPFLTFSHLHSA